MKPKNDRKNITNKNTKKSARQNTLLALEPRTLLDAALVATAADALHDDGRNSAQPQLESTDWQSLVDAFGDAAVAAPPATADAATTQLATQSREIVFLDQHSAVMNHWPLPPLRPAVKLQSSTATATVCARSLIISRIAVTSLRST